MIHVLVVDDHPVVRAGLAALVEADPAMQVTATASGAVEALALTPAAPPDVCVVDLHLPDGDGVTLGAQLKEAWPGTKVLVLTMTADPAAVVRSLGAGLDGYVLKDSEPAELLAAIRAASAGAVVLGRGASGPIVAAAAALPSAEPLALLDARDREVLDLLARGRSISDIAAALYLSPKTVRNRTTQIQAKLGVTTRDEAIAIGRAGGLGH